MNKNSGILFEDKRQGFFLYLIVEAVMFAVLFATYFVFTPSPDGPDPSEVFELRTVIVSSVFLLSSSGTLLIAEKGLKSANFKQIWLGLGLTFLLGLLFLCMEIYEFYTFVHEGYGLTANNFMSAFYILVGLHASHVCFGLLWMAALFFHSARKIPYALFEEKQKIFHYYWHFVDLIWIFIVLLVYMPYLL
ncbi:cytochrome c oxidase subunit 3 [Sediminibacillus massiliensis]|uniref:cytochrome c oxidase subunit 3 n=1 Tax=Sediminibacillus massiliensis TaxID=1926277 RepID=UPI0009883E03|nr:cytochrome c oxidase subunit 3 [Sediminibacillus massiliensis]